MKKIIFLFTTSVFLLSIPAFSQIQQGNILAGGDIANFNIGLQKGSAFSMRIDPKLAFFIKDNVAVGAYIDFGLQTIPGSTGTITTYGVGALARYYLSDKSDMSPLRHSRIFFEGNVGISGINVPGGSNTNGLGIGIGPGLAYFITPNVGLETLLKYNGLLGFGNTTTQSNLNLNVGFQIYLPSKKLRSKIKSDVK
ncbi:MAG: hypothetical protein M3015_00425 [Bacteroidota bacterium]|nr:hypothetical protein [Bacteroidota bacterium]